MIKTDRNDGGNSQSIQNIGNALSERRQDLGYDISFVAFKLKLTSLQLEALEAGNRDFFPGRAYYFGFLKAYADFLGMDFNAFSVDEASEKKAGILRAASPGKHTAQLPELRPLPGVSRKTMPFWIVFISGIAVTVCAYIGWYQVTRPPNQIPLPEQASEESIEAVIPPISEEKRDLSKARQQKMFSAQEMTVSGTHTDTGQANMPGKRKRIGFVALKSDIPVDVVDDKGKSVFSKSLRKDEEWLSPEAGGKYFLSVNDASAIAVRTKNGSYRALGKKGAMLRNFDLSQ